MCSWQRKEKHCFTLYKLSLIVKYFAPLEGIPYCLLHNIYCRRLTLCAKSVVSQTLCCCLFFFPELVLCLFSSSSVLWTLVVYCLFLKLGAASFSHPSIVASHRRTMLVLRPRRGVRVQKVFGMSSRKVGAVIFWSPPPIPQHTPAFLKCWCLNDLSHRSFFISA